MADLNINFQFVSNAQSLEAKPREIQELGEDFARLIVNEVALAASDKSFQRAKRNFIRGISTAVHAEVARMAMLIGKFLPLPDKYTGPNGVMSINGANSGETTGASGMSATARMFHFPSTFDRSYAGIAWKKRSKKYLAWKKRRNMPAKWWAASGDLQRALMDKNAEFYEHAFGPVRVRFVRKAVRGEGGRFAKQGIKTAAVNPGDIEGGARKQVNVARPGGRGNISAEFQVGQVQVDVFGKITPEMFPGLRTMNPKAAKPTPGSLGMAALFPDDGPGGTRNKLLGDRSGNHYRYAIEPFVTFFLTRAIPNAIWRRTELLVGAA